MLELGSHVHSTSCVSVSWRTLFPPTEKRQLFSRSENKSYLSDLLPSRGKNTGELELSSCLLFGWCLSHWSRAFARFGRGRSGIFSGVYTGPVPVCTELATDLSLKASYTEAWTIARILNETGLGTVLNNVAWVARDQMPLFGLKSVQGD